MGKLRLTKDTSAVLYTVIGAFFIALIVGLVVKNPAGTVLARAFVSALLFGGLVYAGMWMLKRYIPEWEASVNRGGKTEGEAGEKESHAPATEADTNASNHVLPEQKQAEVKYPAAVATDDVHEAGTDTVTAEEAVETGADPENDSLPSLDGLFADEAQPLPDYQPEPASKQEPRQVGEKIALGNFRIPYEPETLAKAIKKVMSQDEGK